MRIRASMHIMLLATMLVGRGTGLDAAELDTTQAESVIAAAISAPHPRLLLTAEAEVALRQRLAADPLSARYEAALRAQADDLLDEPVLERKQEGRRLLGVSREALRRLLLLGLAARLSGEERYVERAAAELRAVCAFTDWNPSHWLDVAEMATGVAFAYDWLHAELSPADRALVLDGLTRHAFAVYKANRWSNNWNDVCNGGMVIASLAIAEDAPELAARTLAQAADAMPLALGALSPEGAHDEGGAYWGYATMFSVMALASLESAAGTDLGLIGAHPGWLASGGYFAHLHGPSGDYHNYSDPAHTGRPSVIPQLFWMAKRAGHPEWAWNQAGLIEAQLGGTRRRFARHAPLLLLWVDGSLAQDPPAALDFVSGGPGAIALHRTAWAPDAGWVGFKGGSPSANHAHMDGGSFVYEVDGVRWSLDPGMQDYHQLEVRGINVFGRSQDADRWTIFRMSNLSHSTLVVDGQHQRVDGDAGFVAHGRGWSVLDLSSHYAGQLTSARRGVRLLDDRRLVIRDELQADADGGEVRWQMLTMAEVALDGARATLGQDGRQLELRVLEPAGATIETWDSATPPKEWDKPIEGSTLVGFRVRLEPDQAATLRMVLVPSAAADAPEPEAIQFAEWPRALPKDD